MYLMSRANPSSGRSGGTGTISYSAVFSLPILPNILAEWTSLIPLVSHLASYQNDHQIAGKTSLIARIHVSLFPRLGVLDGLTRLLNGGPDFLDRVSTIGEVSLYVWDVNWGSSFPCANGSASQIITTYALRDRNPKYIDMPEHVPAVTHDQQLGKESPGTLETTQSPNAQAPSPGERLTADVQKKKESKIIQKRQDMSQSLDTSTVFRRYQVLHVLEFGRQLSSKRSTWYLKLNQLIKPGFFNILYHLFLVGLVVVLCLFGTFGTAAVVLNSTMARIMSHYARIKRPHGFLQNNENHKACMLLSSHKNASTWYLYIGDRGVVDSLLNKTMIEISSSSKWLSNWFRLAHFIQLLAMTFVAAQKGWDGLALLLLLLFELVLQWRQNENKIARHWLEAEGVSVKTKSFRFTGRTPMIGAIHKFSGSKVTHWMDEVISPSARREVLLRHLSRGLDETMVPDKDFDNLSSFDQDWVMLHSGLATQAVNMMKSELDCSA